MTEEDRLHQESERGDRAQELLDSPLLIEARDLITKNLHDKWEETAARDTKDREYLYMQLKAHNEVFRHLTTVLTTGRMAKQTLREKIEKWTKLKQS